MNEAVCAEHEKLCDERFARDKERIEKLEDLTGKIGECNIRLTGIAEQHDAKLKDHESRLDELERRPGNLWDKVISGIIAAVVAYVMAIVLHE